MSGKKLDACKMATNDLRAEYATITHASADQQLRMLSTDSLPGCAAGDCVAEK